MYVQILAEPNFMPALNVPGWDLATVNDMAIKFDPSSVNTGNKIHLESAEPMYPPGSFLKPETLHI